MKALDKPWLAALFVAVLFLLVIGAQLAVHGRDVSTFIAIGDRYIVEPEDVPRNVSVLPDSWGYDGQFFYQLALDPFSPQDVNAGLAMDNGPYRHQRILYPLLAWVLSLGNDRLVPAALVLVNYLALCSVAWLGGRYVQLHERHALWGALFALYPGFLFTLTRDLAEIVTVAFLLAAVIVLQRSHARARVGAALLLTLAVLTRETALLAVAALGIALLLYRAYEHWPVVVVPLITYGLWQGGLWLKWGVPPLLAGTQNVGVPGEAFMAFVLSLQAAEPGHLIWILELVYVGVLALVALLSLPETREDAFPQLAWLFYGLLVLSLTQYVWVEDLAFMRAMAEFYLFSLALIVSGSRPGFLALVSLPTVATWALVFFTRLNW
jgi:hypothetical protein